ncbi:MAG: hypothetical protein KAQ94_07125 [Arcobacteraceae bacterium]|nr:hypothetical protein [Arcobacteraceae bacterium]
MRKLLLGLLLSSGIIMANTVAKDDLLNLATAGKSVGTSLEMNKDDMVKADGGWYIRGYWASRINKIRRYLYPTPKPKYKSKMSFADKIFSSANKRGLRYNRSTSRFYYR